MFLGFDKAVKKSKLVSRQFVAVFLKILPPVKYLVEFVQGLDVYMYLL
jgi:hypothetical protein